ncbi:MAG: lipoyl synthase [Bacteroidales bacterium]|nr:lipoyl synthase [Bacteroidales bacterium]MDD2569776.1 lipoyl synthase [Bacteroidales bacterium]MDD2811931.1 lipoyl synthase [Bacteroidales bacterium]MDD3385525.1 lipoyl synthase [Bacteroidales bacterium]MDD3811886.1 lipoyl synthase [Bacteroidales bacterium]
MKSMTRERLPEWMRMSSRLDQDENYQAIRKLVDDNHLHTICTSGNCPNIGECWRAGTATFMILGNICTRACRFCGVPTGKPLPPDESEPQRIAESVKTMGLRHAVITSVDRDDLPDKGATCWAQTIRAVKELNPGITMETLIPDFDGIPELIAQVIDAGPEVISHNLETVARLTPQIRSRAKYQTSLKVIKQIAQSGLVAKSGIMLGLGETREEILETMDDLRAVGCTVLTIGQYLQPTRDHMPVSEWITPEEFKFYEEAGLKKGFRHVESSPLVRSSYHAEKHVR